MPPHQVKGLLVVRCPFARSPYISNFLILMSPRQQHPGLLLSLPQSVEAIGKQLRNEQKHNFCSNLVKCRVLDPLYTTHWKFSNNKSQ